MGLAADGFDISMYLYVKVHFQKIFISENKVHCVLNRARTLTITIGTNLTDGLLINYTRIGSAFNKLSENIYFYILTLLIMAGVFDFLRAMTDY